MNPFFTKLPKINLLNLERVLTIIPESIMVTDINSNIVYFNPAMEELTGYKLVEVLGKNPRILKSGQTPPKTYKKLYQALAQGKPFTTNEVINKRKDNSLYQINASYAPVFAKDEPVFYLQVQHDITKLKETEKELKKMNQAKDEFLHFASHTLRTPLSAIAWAIERLNEDSLRYSFKQKKFLNQIYDQSQRMIRLTNNLLDATRMEFGILSYKTNETDFLTIVSNVISDLTDQINNKKIKIKTIFDKDINNFKVSSNAFYIILHNLLSNAVKFTPAKGRVGLKVSKEENCLTLEVSDSGIGIPKLAQTKIFQKMYRANNVKDKFEGSGLGLYITSGIINHMGGKITVESKPEQKTVFTVTLPLVLEIIQSRERKEVYL